MVRPCSTLRNTASGCPVLTANRRWGMTDTLARDLMPTQWFPDIELTRLAVGDRSIDIVGAGEWALQGDLVLFECKGTLRLSLTEAPRVEIWNGETWQVLPEDFLEHATTVTHLQYDRKSD